jgi:light-harvesting complex I chlorophyll a/b binding protein 1
MYAKIVDADTQRSGRSLMLKASIAVIAGSCGVLLGNLAMSSYTNAGDATNLSAAPALRKAGMVLPMARVNLQNLPGPSPWKELTLGYMEATSQCNRDVSMNANSLRAVMAGMSGKNKAMVARADVAMKAKAQDLLQAGQVAPLSFFDPVGLSTDVPDGKMLFYREAEIKHGRVCMLAFLGILVGEQYHPLFGGDIDIPAAKHFTYLGDAFWMAAYTQFMVGMYLIERKSSFPILDGVAFSGIITPSPSADAAFNVKKDRSPGDIGFDPLGLKPKKPEELLQMQNKEILNGRLSMIAVIGILAQEAVTEEKLFR